MRGRQGGPDPPEKRRSGPGSGAFQKSSSSNGNAAIDTSSGAAAQPAFLSFLRGRPLSHRAGADAIAAAPEPARAPDREVVGRYRQIENINTCRSKGGQP